MALEGKALTGTMSSWPGWHNLIKFNNNTVLPWVTSGAGLGEKRKMPSWAQGIDSPSACKEAACRAFPAGTGLCPCLESVLHDLE